MRMLVKKLKSRKFLAAAAGLVMGLAMIFGLDEAVINTVSGAVVAICSVVTYIITEGKVDAAALSEAVTKSSGAIKLLEGGNNDTQ